MPQDNPNDTTAVQDQVLEAIRESQEATVDACRTWARTFTAVTPKVAEAFATPKVDNYFGFAEKLWGYQRDFTVKLFEAAAEMGRAVPEAANRASAASADRARAAASK